MGNENSQFQEKFKSNYGFIQLCQHQVYGIVKIYRKKFQNYHYVMVIDKPIQSYIKNTSGCLKTNKKMNFDSNQTSLHLNHSTEMFKRQNQRRHSQKMEYSQNNSRQIQMRTNKLKQTLDSIKKYQDSSLISLFSYIIVNQKLQCNQQLIRLYVQYQNHRLVQYLQVIRIKKMHLFIEEVVYILKIIINALFLVQKMQIQLSEEDVNIKSIFTTTEGEVKLDPIYIINRKQQEKEHIQNILIMKQNLQTKTISNERFQLINSNTFDNQSLQSSSSTAQRQIKQIKNQNLVSIKIINKLIADLAVYIDPKRIQQCQKMIFYLRRSSNLNIFVQILNKQWKQSQGLQIERIYQIQQKNKSQQKMNQ